MFDHTRAKVKLLALVAASSIAVASVASAQSRSAIQPPSGYLPAIDPGRLPLILPPPPAAGDGRDAEDRAIFRATRAAEGSSRWTYAQADADLSAIGLLTAFACDLGFVASAESTPRLIALLTRVMRDDNAVVGPLKDRYRRKRPFLIDDGPTCLPKADLEKSFDYPSGHATIGWTTGLILAELWPYRAPQILARARQYGESRVFCGVHNASAVEAGRTVGSAVAGMLHGSAAFRRDIELVREEIGKPGERHTENPKLCAVQSAALAPTPSSSAQAKH
jgi:acid phosphatase (class A)